MLTTMKKSLFLVICLAFSANIAFSADNVLQAIQIEGLNDSYNIVLKSDEAVDIKKTIQAPNKMMINLKGIRASKTINTIYNNTASVDSVVVEPTSEDSIKILVQADNVQNAKIHFDSLKTPLGILGNSKTSKKTTGEITLSDPMTAYRPVYNNTIDEDEETNPAIMSTLISYAKKVMNNEKASWMITCFLFAILLFSVIKFMKGKESNIQIGLNRNLQAREMELYRQANSMNVDLGMGTNVNNIGAFAEEETFRNSTANMNRSMVGTIGNAGYGLKAYQESSKSPYMTPEYQRRNTMNTMNSIPLRKPSNAVPNALQQAAQNIIARQGVNAGVNAGANAATNMGINTRLNATTTKRPISTPVANAKPKTASIDSMKFLESMTKIYEKNGRADLAQGLKSSMQKAKMKV